MICPINIKLSLQMGAILKLGARGCPRGCPSRCPSHAAHPDAFPADLQNAEKNSGFKINDMSLICH